jgi:hypothetical protein
MSRLEIRVNALTTKRKGGMIPSTLRIAFRCLFLRRWMADESPKRPACCMWDLNELFLVGER